MFGAIRWRLFLLRLCRFVHPATPFASAPHQSGPATSARLRPAQQSLEQSFRSEPMGVRSRVACTARERRRELPRAAAASPRVYQAFVCRCLPWSLPAAALRRKSAVVRPAAFALFSSSFFLQLTNARTEHARNQLPTRAKGRKSPLAGSNAFTKPLLIRSWRTFWQENSGGQGTTASSRRGSMTTAQAVAH